MNIGDRVQVKATGERGIIVDADLRPPTKWHEYKMLRDDGSKIWLKPDALTLAGIAIIKGKVSYDENLVWMLGDVVLDNVLMERMGETVRIIIE